MKNKLYLLALLLAALPAKSQVSTLMLAGQAGTSSAGCGATYAHCASFSIPSAPTTLTDFPNAVAPLSQWAAVGSGGQILHTTTQTGGGASITVPADFVVTSDSGCATAIPFEWEKWVSATGTGSALWVKQTRATGSATNVYACWGSTGTTYLGNVNGTWNSAFVRVYHLPTVAAANDSTSAACTLTNVSATDTTGEIDGGTNFVASGPQYLETSACNMPSSSGFTISAWVNLVGGSFSSILGNLSTPGTIEYRIDNDNTQSLLAQQVAAVGNSASAVPTSAWHHVAVTYNAVNARFYLDGVADGAPASSQAITQAVDSVIGAGGGGGDAMNGKIDEVEVSNTVRSADWIAATSSNQTTPITPSVIQ